MATSHSLDAPPADPSGPLEQLLRERWSCRAFEPRQVETATIERMFTLAQLAPSWCNTQPWQVIVTSGAATERFRAGLTAQIRSEGPSRPTDFDTPREYTGVYRERRRESGRQLYEALDIGYDDRAARARQAFLNWELFGAPHVAIVTTATEQGTYGAVDSGLYAGYLLLAAHSLGLGTVPQGAFAYAAPFIREHFSIPPDRKVLLGVAFGYPAEDHPVNRYRTTRAALTDSVRFVTA
ncbi:nitroreductase [Microbacterium invictum]|uniref:Nitroreductase n=1 Tax=Microbacterium invictum TaxID=515415 RepID=A0AA40VNZ1_9MICO|nr:nitroreductase [Microbacterium invictum]MBB4141289.1 nitroreductase [Microbacterium invictum]